MIDPCLSGQDKEELLFHSAGDFHGQGAFFFCWKNLPLGDFVMVSSVVRMPLCMPAGVVPPKSSSVSLVVGKGLSEVPWMAGFTPPCPAGRIPFWTSGLA